MSKIESRGVSTINVLIEQNMGLGDVVFLEPSLRLLLQEKSVNKIVVVLPGQYKDLLSDYNERVTVVGIGDVTKYTKQGYIHIKLTAQSHYDMGDIQRYKAFTSIVFNKLSLVINPDSIPSPQLEATPKDASWGNQHVQHPSVLYQINSFHKEKDIDLLTAQQEINQYVSKGYQVWVIANDGKSVPSGAIWVKGFSVSELKSLCASVDKYIGLDSGPTWIANALGIDTTVCFISTQSRLYTPVTSNLRIIKRNTDALSLVDAINKGNPVGIKRKGGIGDAVVIERFIVRRLAELGIDVSFYVDDYMVELSRNIGVNAYPLSDSTNSDVVFDFSMYMERIDPSNIKIRPDVIMNTLGQYKDTELHTWNIPLQQDSNTIGIQVSSSSAVRVYPPHLLKELIELLSRNGYRVMLFGQNAYGIDYASWSFGNTINLVDRLSLADSVQMMTRCKYFIAPDSGLMHIANVLGIKNICLFGNIHPLMRLKYYPNATPMLVKDKLPCMFCGDVESKLKPSCKKRIGADCMYILPQDIIDTLLTIEDSKKSCNYCKSPVTLCNTIQGNWFGSHIDKPIEFYRCNVCGSIISEGSNMYGESYWVGYKYMDNKLHLFDNVINQTMSIMEIGCGRGELVENLLERGYNITGIDISDYAIIQGSEKGLPISRADIETYQTDKTFDCIIGMDIWEHLNNPVESYQKIRGWLNPNGIICIYTPDAEGHWADDKRHWLWSPNQHFNIPSYLSLKTLAETNGDIIQSVKEDNHMIVVITKGDTE